MAIYLITGTPGAGKTLNTIKAVYNRAKDENRAVFYANIDGITFDNWHEMQDESQADLHTEITPYSWQNAPDGSILLFDECQDFYPSISPNAQQPDYIMDFAKHRHRGFDVYLITQGPNLINSKIKDWVSPHIHYRRIFGGSFTYSYTNEQVVNNIRDVNAIARSAIKERVKLDKSFFDTYKSASMHTENKRINKKLVLLFIIPLFLIPLSIYYIYSSINGFFDDDVVTEEPIYYQNPPTIPFKEHKPNFFNSSADSDNFDPILMYQPRIKNMPETAPAYDELRKPVDFPRPQCVASSDFQSCNCYSQQSSLLHDYPHDLCVDYVKNGYFDPTKERKDFAHDRNGRPRAAVTDAVQNQPIVTL